MVCADDYDYKMNACVDCSTDLEQVYMDEDDEEFYFNLSAFLNAWRSILDVMMYDFNDFFALGFSREDEITEKEFGAVANALKNIQATEFIEWWRKKQGLLRNNKLWSKRNVSFHRGYPPLSEKIYNIYVGNSGWTSGTLSSYWQPIIYPSLFLPDSPEYSTVGPMPPTGPIPVRTINPHDFYFTELSELSDKPVIKYCDEALKIIEGIVEEAEKKFSVKLASF